MCRQIHGFLYEEKVIKKYNLIKSDSYTSKYDAFTVSGIPVQIKCIKENASIDLGDYCRNITSEYSYYLIIGRWRQSKKIIISENIHYIDISIFKSKIKQNTALITAMKDEMKNISNSREDDLKWRAFVKKYKKLHDKRALLQPRFKRDHKSQKRIQCAINNNYYNTVFCKLFKPLKEIIHH